MSFIQREHDRLNELLRSTPSDAEVYQPIYAAQQALGWALDPDCCASPSAMLHKFFGAGREGTKGTGIKWAKPGEMPAPSH